jgi:hypothetical protein
LRNIPKTCTTTCWINCVIIKGSTSICTFCLCKCFSRLRAQLPFFDFYSIFHIFKEKLTYWIFIQHLQKLDEENRNMVNFDHADSAWKQS